jgi:hypothetical protein
LAGVGGVVRILADGRDSEVVAPFDEVAVVLVTDDCAAEDSVSAACVPGFDGEVAVCSAEEVGDSVDAGEEDTSVPGELAVDTLGALADSGPTSANPPIVVAQAGTITTDRHSAANRKNRFTRSGYLRRSDGRVTVRKGVP